MSSFNVPADDRLDDEIERNVTRALAEDVRLNLWLRAVDAIQCLDSSNLAANLIDRLYSPETVLEVEVVAVFPEETAKATDPR